MMIAFRLRFLFASALLAAVMSLSFAADPPPLLKTYAVQFGAFDTETAAQSLAGEFIGRGFAPVVAIERGEGPLPWKVWWGNFETLAEAKAWQHLAAAHLPEGAFIAADEQPRPWFRVKAPIALPLSEAWLSSLTPDLEYQTDYDPAPPAPAEAAALLAAADLSQLNADQILLKGTHTRNLDESIAILENGIHRFGAQPEGAALRLRLARKLMAKGDYARSDALLAEVRQSGPPAERAKADWVAAYSAHRQKRLEESLQQFKACAALPDLPAVDRMDAVLRVATIIHHRGETKTTNPPNEDMFESWFYYRQLGESGAPENVLAFCALQRLGLEMELAWREKGRLDECVLLAQRSLARYPLASPRIRATFRLMELECEFYLGRRIEFDSAGVYLGSTPESKAKYNTTIALAQALRRDMPTELRENLSSYYFEALAQAHMNNYEEAISLLEIVMNQDIPDYAQFGGTDKKIECGKWLAFLHQQLNRPDKHDEYMRIVAEREAELGGRK